MDETQPNNSNKNAIRIAILILALLWVVVMNNILGNKNSSSGGMQTFDITRQVAVAECNDIEVSELEMDIVTSILQVSEIGNAVSNKEKLNYYGDRIKEFGIQDSYQELYPTMSVTQITTDEDNIIVTGQDNEANFGYKFQYYINGEYTKILFTLDDATKPFYKNSNNEDYTKTLF